MSYFTRLRDPILALLKDEAAGPAPVAGQPRDRAEAARRAWEVRRARYGPGGGNVGKGGAKDQPNQGNSADINKDLEESLAKLKAHDATLEQSMPWAKKERKKGGGVNTSGIAEIDGKKYFAKLETESEAGNEKGAWDAAQAVGWDDLARPSATFTRAQATSRDKQGVVLNPLLPEGEPLLEMTDGNMGIIKRMQSSDVHPTRDKIERMMLFEHVIGAVDRHGGNYWADKNGDLYGIDYGRSFMTYSDAEQTVAGSNKSDEYGGLWDRSFNADRTIAREHIQKIVDSESKLLKSVPLKGGWRTSRESAQEAMTERIAKLRDILKNNKNKHIDLRDEGVWA
jgi:hypothetical protein